MKLDTPRPQAEGGTGREMRPVPLSDSERRALSERLGVALHLIPTHRKICPPRTYAIDVHPEGKGTSWRQDRSEGMRRMQRDRRMAALKARERLEQREEGGLVMIAGPVRTREPSVDGLAKQRPGSKPRVRKSRAKKFIPQKPAKGPNIRADVELRFLELLKQGLSRRAAGVVIGMASSGSIQFIIKKLKAAGYELPPAGNWQKGSSRVRVVK